MLLVNVIGLAQVVPPPVVLNVAVTLRAWLINTEQVVPVQAPLQPANVEPVAAAAVSVTVVVLEKLAEQAEPQLTPVGDDVTVPAPVPALVTVSVKLPGAVLNVAVTFCDCDMVTMHWPVPVQAPLQPANVEPVAGVALSVTCVAGVVLATFAEHVVPQLIGPPATVPVPVPIFVMLSGNVAAALNVAVTLRAADMVTVQVPVTLVHAPLQPANVDPAAGVAVRVT